MVVVVCCFVATSAEVPASKRFDADCIVSRIGRAPGRRPDRPTSRLRATVLSGAASGEQLLENRAVADDGDRAAGRGAILLVRIDAQAVVKGRRHVVGRDTGARGGAGSLIVAGADD